VQDLADQVAADDPDQPMKSNGIWERRTASLLVDGDIGRWLVLDRAIWITRGWRPWHPRRRWISARDIIAARILAALDDGLLPQSYDDDPLVPDASSLMAVAFGLIGRDDPRAARLVDNVIRRLGAGPFLYRYPPTGEDGFAGREGAFLPMSFLVVTALATIGRVDEAERRLDGLCAALPRLLSEEVDPQSGRLLGNTPLVWSHAELARALYVPRRRTAPPQMGRTRAARLAADAATAPPPRPQLKPADQQGARHGYTTDPAGPPAASIRPRDRRRRDAAHHRRRGCLRRAPARRPDFLEQRRRMALLQTRRPRPCQWSGLYQFGLLRAVPEPPLPGLDATWWTRPARRTRSSTRRTAAWAS
jgi:hypothetical protein